MKKIIFVSFFSLFVFLVGASNALAANDCTTAFPGYSCIDSSNGTNCQAGHCPGAANIQCCAPKGAATGNPQGAATGASSGATLPNPLGTTNINTLVARIISYILGLVGTISLLLFVYGGLIWMTSAGNSSAVKKGRDILIWAVIGMAVVFTSYILVKFVIQGIQGTL